MSLLVAACVGPDRPLPREKPSPPAIETPLSAMPEPLSNNAVATLERGGRPYFYSFFGLPETKSAARISRAAYEFDPLADSWRRLPPVPVDGGRLAASAVGLGDRIYLFGGYTVAADGRETTQPHAFAFDPATNRYERLPDIPKPVDDSVALPYLDRYIYLVSGWHQDGNVPHVQVFDTVTRRWFAATDYPGLPVFGHAGGIVGNKMLIADGVTVTAPPGTGPSRFENLGDVWLGEISPDDPSIIDWRPMPAHDGPPLYRAGAAGLDSRNWVVFAGGTDNPYNYDGIGYDGRPASPSDQVLVFDLAEEQWIARGQKPHSTMDHRGLVVDGETLFTIGGMGPGQVVTGAIVQVFPGPPPAG
ncbi:MAG: Kelch repeat-containing protein [Rhodothalassiaceae bacterium]